MHLSLLVLDALERKQERIQEMSHHKMRNAAEQAFML